MKKKIEFLNKYGLLKLKYLKNNKKALLLMKDKLNENLFSVSIITKEGKEEITNKEFEEILLLRYNNHNKYLINFLTPEARAFYLTNKHTRNRLSNYPLINHINSALDIFIC